MKVGEIWEHKVDKFQVKIREIEKDEYFENDWVWFEVITKGNIFDKFWFSTYMGKYFGFT